MTMRALPPFSTYTGCPTISPATPAPIRSPTHTPRLRCSRTPFRQDINDERFIPYLQLHEFEALLFADPRQLEIQFDNRENAIEKPGRPSRRSWQPGTHQRGSRDCAFEADSRPNSGIRQEEVVGRTHSGAAYRPAPLAFGVPDTLAIGSTGWRN